MFLKCVKGFIATVSLLTLANCSSSSSSSGNVDNLVTQTYSEVLQQAAQAAGDADQALTAKPKPNANFVERATTFGADWDTNSVVNNPVTNSGMIPIKEYMGIQLNDTLTNNNGSSVNVFGRLKTGLGIFCAVGVMTGLSGVAVDSNGYPEDGAHTVEFTSGNKAQILSQCDMDVSDIPTGTSMVVTVAASSGDFEKSFTFDTFTQTYLVKSTATEVNIATGEVHDSGTGVSRTNVMWNKTTNVMRVQYVSDPGVHASGNSGLYGYRLYYDEANDEAQIFAYEGPDTDLASATRYILAGKPQTGDGLSLSFRTVISVNSGDMLEACVNPNTGDIISMLDGVRCSASSTRLAGASVDDSAGAGTIDGMIAAFFSDSGDPAWATVTPSTTMTWDMTTMLTQHFAP